MTEKEWKLTGTIINQFQLSKENLTKSGFEPETSGLTYQCSQLSSPIQYSIKFEDLDGAVYNTVGRRLG